MCPFFDKSMNASSSCMTPPPQRNCLSVIYMYGIFGSVWEWVWFSWESGCGLLVDRWYVHFLSPWLGMHIVCLCVGDFICLSWCVSDYPLSMLWLGEQAALFVSVHSPSIVWENRD